MNDWLARRRCLQALLAGLWLICASALSAESEFDFDVRTPSVMAIRSSLVERFAILKEHFEAGVIGLTHDGLIAMRESGNLAPEIRTRLDLLVVDDNKDRGTMYREIARANGRPDWESQFQSVFAERWISRAPIGWYYRDAGGQWTRKLSRDTKQEARSRALSAVPFPGN